MMGKSNYWNRIINKFILLSLLSIMIACDSEYEKLVKREIDKGVKYDSLFLGLSFGDQQKAFYKKCWDLNKQGLVQQGPGNTTVQYMINENTPAAITMLFYPEFNASKQIESMEVKFSYVAWAPWNKQYHSDKLIEEIKGLLQKWYKGNTFIKVDMEKWPNEIWVKVDGNRRISLIRKDEQTVIAKMDDLSAKPLFKD